MTVTLALSVWALPAPAEGSAGSLRRLANDTAAAKGMKILLASKDCAHVTPTIQSYVETHAGLLPDGFSQLIGSSATYTRVKELAERIGEGKEPGALQCNAVLLATLEAPGVLTSKPEWNSRLRQIKEHWELKVTNGRNLEVHRALSDCLAP